MQKLYKPLLLVLAVALMGAIPASASAGNLYSGASEVALGTSILGKSVNGTPNFYSGESVYVECSGANLSGAVAKNNSVSSEIGVESLTFTGTAAEGKCANLVGAVKIATDGATCLRYTFGGYWQLRGGSCSIEPTTLRFTYVGSGFQCKYRVPSGLVFTSNVNSEPLVLTQGVAGTEFVKVEGAPLCVTSLTLKNLNLELKTASGQGLKVLK
jgi:hypothetical protein